MAAVLPSPADVLPDVNWHGFPRISPEGFTAAETAACVIAVGAAITRTGLRLYHFRKLSVDDIALFVSVVLLIGCYGLSCHIRDYTYGQVFMGLGFMTIPPDVVQRLVYFLRVSAALNVLQWTSIFIVKFSYLLFFKKLIERVRWMAILWWTITAFVVMSGIVCIILPTTFCTYYGDDLLHHCNFDTIFRNEYNGLLISVVLDITTDLAVLALPLILISKVRLTLTRKLAIASILCLSTFMILIASIRLAFAYLPGRITPGRITDTVWLSFWQTMEVATAILMVSVTGFRSVFGQVQRKRMNSPYAFSASTSGSGSGSRTVASARGMNSNSNSNSNSNRGHGRSGSEDKALMCEKEMSSANSSPISALPPVSPAWPARLAIVRGVEVKVESRPAYREGMGERESGTRGPRVPPGSPVSPVSPLSRISAPLSGRGWGRTWYREEV